MQTGGAQGAGGPPSGQQPELNHHLGQAGEAVGERRDVVGEALGRRRAVEEQRRRLPPGTTSWPRAGPAPRVAGGRLRLATVSVPTPGKCAGRRGSPGSTRQRAGRRPRRSRGPGQMPSAHRGGDVLRRPARATPTSIPCPGGRRRGRAARPRRCPTRRGRASTRSSSNATGSCQQMIEAGEGPGLVAAGRSSPRWSCAGPLTSCRRSRAARTPAPDGHLDAVDDLQAVAEHVDALGRDPIVARPAVKDAGFGPGRGGRRRVLSRSPDWGVSALVIIIAATAGGESHRHTTTPPAASACPIRLSTDVLFACDGRGDVCGDPSLAAARP